MNRSILTSVMLLTFFALTGCATFNPPSNKAVSRIPARDQSYGLHRAHGGDLGSNLVFLTFSGGGTRAAALAYGVLKELKNTSVLSKNKRIRLLDDIDSISAVSGGSFTAAYYGLFGDRIFEDYESKFLKRSIQGFLIQKLFHPSYWLRSIFSGFDRTEMAIEYYDDNIFEGKTFNDIALAHRPHIEINATNLGTASRFAFTQLQFDTICSDLMSVNVARAVMASSAVPILFTPVVLTNYAGACDSQENLTIKNIRRTEHAGPRMVEMKERLDRYQERDNHPYIHLVDGGVSDNLGSRSTTERLDAYHAGTYDMFGRNYPDNILMITVNAEVDAKLGVDKVPDKPSLGDTLEAYTKTQMEIFNKETEIVLEKRLEELRQDLEKKGHAAEIFSVSVDFKSIRGESLKKNMNTLPTSLQLSSDEIDEIVEVGQDVLRRNDAFRAFLTKTQGHSMDSVQ